VVCESKNLKVVLRIREIVGVCEISSMGAGTGRQPKIG
jgi:hypothetical protein